MMLAAHRTGGDPVMTAHRRRTRLAAPGLAGLALALDAAAVLLVLPQLGADVLARMDASTLGGYVLGATFPIVGWLIATRRPGNAIGWIFLGIGLSQALDAFAGQYGVVGLVTSPGSLPAADVASWVAVWAWAPGFTLLLTCLLLMFPDGHLPSRRWRPVASVAVVSLVLLVVPVAIVAWFSRGPGLLGTGSRNASSDPTVSMLLNLQFVGLILLLGCGLASIAGLVVRFRRSVGVERAQLKWFVSAGIIEVVCLGSSAIVTLPGPLAAVMAITVSPLVPIAATVAILRYRLYDIDRIVSRTVSYASVTSLLAVLFAGLVVALQAVLAPFTRSGSIAVAGSTLVVAAAFQPLRSRVQRLVDRRFNRARFDANSVASGFAGRIRDQVDVGTVIGALDDAIDRTVQPMTAGVWLRTTKR